METTEQSEAQSTESSLNIFQNILKKTSGLRLATQAATVSSLDRNLRAEDAWVDRTRAAAHKSTHGEEYQPMSAEDDEMINVGDNNSTNHYYPAAAQQKQDPSTLASLAKSAIVAAGMASGLGGAGWFIAEALDKQPAPVPVPEFKDTNTQYEIILK